MSYDIWLEQDGVAVGESLNYTSNTCRVFYTNMSPSGIHGLNGLPAYEACKVIMTFWDNLQEECLHFWEREDVGEPKLCAKYDAENGWGSLIGTILFIARFQSQCIKYPFATVRLSA
jgi:hypothetical protein